MFRLAGLCIIFLFSTLSVSALDASVAYNLFYKYDSTKALKYQPVVDIYWQVNPGTLHFFTTAEKTIVARIKTDIVFTNSDGVLIEDHFILQTPPKTDAADLATINILELKQYAVAKGLVKILFRLTDMNDTANKFVFRDSISVVFDDASPVYSGIQLLDTAFKSTAKTPFSRNGKQQLPLCADFLDDNKRTLHYYAEIYNRLIPAKHFPLVQNIRIGKKENDEFFAEFVKTDTFLKELPAFTEGSMGIGGLKSGNYYLVALLADKNGSTIATRSHFFQRLNRNLDVAVVDKKQPAAVFNDTAIENITVLDLDKTFMAKFTKTQLRAILKMLLPVSDPMQTNTINGFLKKPDEMYMRYYIYNYFQALNSKDPAQAWKEYSEKVKVVNRKYTSQGTPGYETERGFIYLRYGVPSEVVTVSNETGALPYEIWQYNTLTQFSNKKELANSLFLFYKPAQLMSEYRLLHSTVPGEPINLSWRMYLYATPNTPNTTNENSNSRAEQYIGSR